MTVVGRRGALVFGGTSSALGVVRSLARRGIPACMLARGGRFSFERLLASASRFPERILPWPASEEAAQVAYLLALAERYGLNGWTLIPTGDEDAALLARNQAVLGKRFCIATASWPDLERAYDKRLTYQLASQVGVAYPWTAYPAELGAVADLECEFPVILKPAIKRGYNRFTHAKAWRVDGRDDLQQRYAEACALVARELVMVQELIPGGGETQFSYAALCSEGRILASLVARRARQYPIDFGLNSTFVETVEVPGLEEPARHLLEALHYTGAVEVEFKFDRRTGTFKLLDINARLWAWHTLGRRAGVDFSYLLWRLAQGEPIQPVRARTGARWVSVVGDVRAGVSEIRRGRLTAGEYVRSLMKRPIELATFALDDPLPALLEAPLQMYLLAKPAGFDERAWLRQRLRM